MTVVSILPEMERRKTRALITILRKHASGLDDLPAKELKIAFQKYTDFLTFFRIQIIFPRQLFAHWALHDRKSEPVPAVWREACSEMANILAYYVLDAEREQLIRRRYKLPNDLVLGVSVYDDGLPVSLGAQMAFKDWEIVTYEQLLTVEAFGRKLPWWHISLYDRLQVVPKIGHTRAGHIVTHLRERGICENLP